MSEVRANGVRLHLLRYGGQGPRLLLLPGITSPAITWGFVADRWGWHPHGDGAPGKTVWFELDVA